MPQSTYTSVPNPEGVLLPDIDSIRYTNFDPSYIPQYGATYLLKDFKETTTSNYFRPYVGLTSIESYTQMAYDASDNLFVISSFQEPEFTTNFISVIRDNTVSNVVPLYEQIAASLQFDNNNSLYIIIIEEISTNPSVYNSKLVLVDIVTQSLTDVSITGVSFNKLYDLTFDTSNNIYLSDSVSNTIFKITLTTPTSGIGEVYASGLSGINTPRGITSDFLDNIYVCNSGDNTVVKIEPDGHTVVFSNSDLDNPYDVNYNNFNN